MLSACQSTPRVYEQLLPALPSARLKNWPLSYQQQGVYVSQIWQHPQRGTDDALLISRFVGVQRPLAGFRTMQDKPGQEKCAHFTSRRLAYSAMPANEALFWVTDCEHPWGGHASILQLAIQGDYALYHVQRIWAVTPSAAEQNYWQQVLANMILCHENDEPCVLQHKQQTIPAQLESQ